VDEAVVKVIQSTLLTACQLTQSEELAVTVMMPELAAASTLMALLLRVYEQTGVDVTVTVTLAEPESVALEPTTVYVVVVPGVTVQVVPVVPVQVPSHW
jgi:hypothetical protein